MKTIYALAKYVNEFRIDEDEKVIEQLGPVGNAKVIAYSKSALGLLRVLEEYFDEEYSLAELADDSLVKKKKLKYPKRRLDYRRFDCDGEIRHLVSLTIITKNTVLKDCL